MTKRKSPCWFVVSFYAGDLARVEAYRPDIREKPTGFVRGTYGGRGGKAVAIRDASRLDEHVGKHAFVRAYQCDVARKRFSLKV